MKEQNFLCGMVMGAAVGTVVGVTMLPRKRSKVQKAADKAIKNVGEVIENLSEEMGLQ